MKVFIVSTGVSGNLGDAVIRRRVLRWFEGLGERHVYVGNTTEGWLEQLQLAGDDIVYAGGRRKAWLRALLFGRGRRVLVFDPGEVPLGRAHLKSEAMFLVMVLWLRLRGGYVVRPPRAVAHYEGATGRLHRWGCLLSQEVMWRDALTLERMRCGQLVPDTAFGEPLGPMSAEPRDLVVLSLRGPRSFPPDAWFDAVATYAERRSLRIVVASQVDEDEERTVEIAARLAHVDAELVPWGDEGDLAREVSRRELYSRAHAVVSDRLHVLLLAAQAGAIPFEVVERPVPKIASHFAVAGLDRVTLDADGRGAEEIVSWFLENDGDPNAVRDRLDAARARLDGEVARIRGQLV